MVMRSNDCLEKREQKILVSWVLKRLLGFERQMSEWWREPFMTPSPRYQPVRIDVRTNHEFGLCMEFPPTNIPRSDTSTDGGKIAKEAPRRQQRRNANRHLITVLELLRLQQENTQRLLLNPPPPLLSDVFSRTDLRGTLFVVPLHRFWPRLV